MDLSHGWIVALDQIASLVTSLFELTIIFVLWRKKSLSRFPLFAFFLLSDSVRSLSLWVLAGSVSADSYRAAWITTEPLNIVLQIALVVEVMRLLYDVYPGIHSFGKIAITVAVVVSGLVTLFSAPLGIHRSPQTESGQLLLHLFQIERVLDLGLCIITAITVGLFPAQHYAHSVRRHGFLLSIFFGIETAGFYAINYGFSSELMGLLLLTAHLVLYPFWIRVFLTPEPELLPVPSPEEITRVKQLNEDLLLLARWLTDRK